MTFISITDPSSGTGTQIHLMSLIWDGMKTFLYSTEDPHGVKSVYSETAVKTIYLFDFQCQTNNQVVGQWFSFTAWVLLNTHKAAARFSYIGPGSGSSLGSPSYDAPWTINMAPKVYACSDVNRVASIKCKLTNLKVWYQSPEDTIELRDGITRKILS